MPTLSIYLAMTEKLCSQIGNLH